MSKNSKDLRNAANGAPDTPSWKIHRLKMITNHVDTLIGSKIILKLRFIFKTTPPPLPELSVQIAPEVTKNRWYCRKIWTRVGVVCFVVIIKSSKIGFPNHDVIFPVWFIESILVHRNNTRLDLLIFRILGVFQGNSDNYNFDTIHRKVSSSPVFFLTIDMLKICRKKTKAGTKAE